MVDVTISISSLLANKFVTALEYYNTKNETEFTPKQMVRKLARQFVIDNIKELRINEAHIGSEEEVAEL